MKIQSRILLKHLGFQAACNCDRHCIRHFFTWDRGTPRQLGTEHQRQQPCLIHHGSVMICAWMPQSNICLCLDAQSHFENHPQALGEISQAKTLRISNLQLWSPLGNTMWGVDSNLHWFTTKWSDPKSCWFWVSIWKNSWRRTAFRGSLEHFGTGKHRTSTIKAPCLVMVKWTWSPVPWKRPSNFDSNTFLTPAVSFK